MRGGGPAPTVGQVLVLMVGHQGWEERGGLPTSRCGSGGVGAAGQSCLRLGRCENEGNWGRESDGVLRGWQRTPWLAFLRGQRLLHSEQPASDG